MWDDFLAPLSYPFAEKPETAADDVDEDWGPDQGFPDSLRVVRV